VSCVREGLPPLPVSMVYGVWCVVYGVWCMVCGVCCVVYGVCCVVYGVCCVGGSSSSTTANATSTGGCVGVVWLLCWVVVVGLFVVLGWRCVSVGGSGTDQQQHDCHHFRLVWCVVYGVWCMVYGVWCVCGVVLECVCGDCVGGTSSSTTAGTVPYYYIL
jgi:hypothetical protein